MEKKVHNNKRYGLVGKDIAYSFSRSYFAEKFQKEEIEWLYRRKVGGDHSWADWLEKPDITISSYQSVQQAISYRQQPSRWQQCKLRASRGSINLKQTITEAQ